MQLAPAMKNAQISLEGLVDGQEIKTPCLDNCRCSYFEDSSKKEKASAEYRQDLKAERGGDTAKGIQHWIVAGFASLKSRLQRSATDSSLAMSGAFILSDPRLQRSARFSISSIARNCSVMCGTCGMFAKCYQYR